MESSDRAFWVLGLGKTGFSCVRYLSARGHTVVALDTRELPPRLTEFCDAFAQVPVFFGVALEAALKTLSLPTALIVSPGVPLDHPVVTAQRQRGVPVYGDVELFARDPWITQARVAAITGSNGKSTVTAMLGAMMQLARGKAKVAIAGNIGVPVLEVCASDIEDYVLELSSFQLETTESLAPTTAVVLNICPDHLDRYPDLETYAAAKQRIYRQCRYPVLSRAEGMPAMPEAVSFGADVPAVGHFGLRADRHGVLHLAYGEDCLLPVSALKVRGLHNATNALAALALGSAMGVSMPLMLQALGSFTGLAHRCQWVCQHRGVDWYNDSKATNVGAVVAALGGLGPSVLGKLVLLLGGLAKEKDFSALTSGVAHYARSVILFGRDADLIAPFLPRQVPVLQVSSLSEAVEAAAQVACSGDAVLLSPACASFDAFTHFEQRGDHFMAVVRALCGSVGIIQ